MNKNYIVYDGRFNFEMDDYEGKVFATIEEAKAYADLLFRETKRCFAVCETEKQVTYMFQIAKNLYNRMSYGLYKPCSYELVLKDSGERPA